jgi:hypothetical protein
MKNRIFAGLTLAGVAILASCGQDLTQSTAVPTAASFAKVVTPVCSFSTANNDARSYFVSNKDAVFALLDAMSTAYRAGGAAGATSAGWAVLARLGAAADAGSAVVKGSPALGSTFANDVLLCMTVPTYAYPLDLSAALGPNGLFAVRDGTGNAPVMSRLIIGGVPAYGAEPSTGNWPVAGSTLFYGNQLFVSQFANETPAGVLFDLKTLPGGLTFSPEIKAGVCTISDPNARVLHQHVGNNPVILPPADALSFCTPPTSMTQSGTSMFAAAASRLATWLAPAPANAATMAFAFGGGGTGLINGLSDIGPVSYTSVVTYTVPPANTSVSANPQFVPTVTVQNLTANGNALKGVLITLSVVSNSGSFTITGNTATTDVNGIATFPNLNIDKAGGYTMTASSELGGSANVFFNINGQ